LMKLIPIAAIQIPENRLRRQFDEEKIQDLARSIASSKGLMHPLVLRSDGVTLVAGERRLRAITLLSESKIPFRCLGQEVLPGFAPCNSLFELSHVELLEAELEENVLRADLSVAEIASAYSRLHTLRSIQAEARGESQSVKATATEILGREATGSARQKVEDLLIIAQHLENPDVAKAKSVNDALKFIRKDLQATHNANLATSTNLNPSDHSLLRGDVREHLPRLADETFACIITDPPYGVGADEFGDQAANRHTYSDRPEEARALYTLLAEHGFRVAKPRAHLYAFCDLRSFADLDLIFTLAGWTVWKWPLIWAKGGGMLPDPKHGPRRTYECILYAIKGKKEVSVVAPDVIAIPSITDPKRGAEKPSELYVDLLRRSTLPGDSILDPFCGTGPVFTAATKLRLKATGIELDPVAQGIANERLNAKAPERDVLDFS